MKYTIDIGSFSTEFRLKKEGSFRAFKKEHFKELEEDDKIFLDYSEAQKYAKSLESAEIEGNIVKVNTGVMGEYNVDVRPHRTGKPKKHLITREELKEVLINGDESRHNSLIIDTDGFFKLIPFSEWRTTPYAVRYETFGARNGYVGLNSSLNHLESTYLAMLDGWESHLYCHDEIYKDYADNVNEEKTIKKIKELIEAM